MTVVAADERPCELRQFPTAHYSFYRLTDTSLPFSEPYGVVALGEREECLELHLTLLRFSPRVLRCLREDMHWLKRHARRRGKKRIVGGTNRSNRLLSKFAQKFGFTACRDHVGADGRIYQLTYKEV